MDLLIVCLMWLGVSGTQAPTVPPPNPVRHFLIVDASRFPTAVFQKNFCDPQQPACWDEFLRTGMLWAADVDDDNVDDLLIFPGVRHAGSGGPWYFLYHKTGDNWRSIAETDDGEGWQTTLPRFDVLPVVRYGRHDLRVAVDRCLKWTGDRYVEYEPQDYRPLPDGWFNAADNHEAEIFWTIRYAGQQTVTLEPQWFPVSREEFLHGQKKPPVAGADLPRTPGQVLEDPQQGITWVALARGGVWGIRGERGFLLVPRLADPGVGHLTIQGDWLVAFETAEPVPAEDEHPLFRYNRRTHELRLEPEPEGKP